MKVAYLGSKPLGLAILKAVFEVSPSEDWQIIHPADQKDGRSCLGDFSEFARAHDIQFDVVKSQVDADRVIQEFQPDVILVCGWYWLIGEAILQIPEVGVFGIHNSLLPKYRGGAPLVWSIINGDTIVGSSVFQIKPGMDDGPILVNVKVALAEHEDIADALARIEAGLVRTLPEKWEALLAGTAALKPQDDAQATFVPQRKPKDGRIDWGQNAVTTHNFIRAQTRPYPGAFFMDGDRKISIWKSSVDVRTGGAEAGSGKPGELLARAADHFVIACGENSALKIMDVSVDGEPASLEAAFGISMKGLG